MQDNLKNPDTRPTGNNFTDGSKPVDYILTEDDLVDEPDAKQAEETLQQEPAAPWYMMDVTMKIPGGFLWQQKVTERISDTFGFSRLMVMIVCLILGIRSSKLRKS